MTIKEAAERWGISERRINELCKTGRIDGAEKIDRQWFIPADAEKPKDQRIRHDNAPGTAPKGKKLPLPIGISDYRRASTQYYYVDKTLMIRDFIDERPQVALFTRPRRFGKTLNMDMMRTFFERSEEDNAVYFRNKKIWECGQEYRSYQGKYPVIYVTFKDIKCDNWEDTFDLFRKILQSEFSRHGELVNSEKLEEYDKRYFSQILRGEGNENDYALAFLHLTRMLDLHYGIPPVIIIDEYDTPIHQGYVKGFYDPVISFMRNLFSGGLKDNRHLSFGFLTGILRVAKESIFSGLNNLKTYTILDESFSEYFGFTTEEVREMAEYYGVPEKMDEICEWYDGYRFSGHSIFNPWSVTGYFSNHCALQAYWQSTGSNDIIREILADATPDTMKRLEALMKGQTFMTHVDTGVIYPQIKNDPSAIFSFLLVAGYLKAARCDPSMTGDYMCEVALPNKEISYVYSKEILAQLQDIIPPSSAMAIQEAMYAGDVHALESSLKRFLLETMSYHDASSEGFYHGLILGLCAMMDNRYRISSNRESGNGRYDIQMTPLGKGLPGILMELKWEKTGGTDLGQLAGRALDQIRDKQYETELRSQGIETIIRYGIAFHGKEVVIRTS